MSLSSVQLTATFHDSCVVMQLGVVACLEGTDIKYLRCACSLFKNELSENTLIRNLAACGYEVHDKQTVHDMLQSSRSEISSKLTYNLAFNQARILNCTVTAISRTPDELGRLPLYMAVRMHRYSLIEPLLHMGAEIDKGSLVNGWSPLLLASWMGDVPAVKKLIRLGSNVDFCGRYGFTPLAAAVAAYNFESCNVLLAAGANLELAAGLMQSSGSVLKDDIVKLMYEVAANRRIARCACPCAEPSAALAMMMHFARDVSDRGANKKQEQETDTRWMNQLVKIVTRICSRTVRAQKVAHFSASD